MPSPYEYEDIEDDELGYVTQEDIDAYAQQLAAQYVQQHFAELEGEGEDDTDDAVAYLLGKINNLESKLGGRELTGREFDKAADLLVNDPDADLDPSDFERGTSEDETREFLVEAMEDAHADQEANEEQEPEYAE